MRERDPRFGRGAAAGLLVGLTVLAAGATAPAHGDRGAGAGPGLAADARLLEGASSSAAGWWTPTALRAPGRAAFATLATPPSGAARSTFCARYPRLRRALARQLRSARTRLAAAAKPAKRAAAKRRVASVKRSQKTAAARFRATCRPRRNGGGAPHVAEGTPGTTTPADPPTPAPDVTAPAVTSRLPAPGATTVLSDARVVARFSEPLAADSIGAGSVRLVASGTAGLVPATVVLSADGHEVTVVPHAPLDPATRYEVTITRDVVDLAGNALTELHTWSFTVAPVTTRTQIATGAMLGVGRNPRWLFVSVSGGPWRPTYADGNPAAHGKLMNFRAANAIYDDENRALVPGFDPDVNTDEFVRWIPTYRALGILGFTISLQGGKPGYEGNVSSAFRPDGSLKPEWLDRAERVIRAADAQGMVVILTYFYKVQEPRLAGDEALRRGTLDATDWLIARGFGNVIIDIANEYDTSGYRHPIFTADNGHGGVAELIRLAQSRFAGRGYRLPVGASHTGLEVPPKIAAVSDLTLVHGNPHPPAEDGAMVAALVADPSVPGPVIINEDFNGFGASAANVEAERQSASNVFRAGGSWGLMWQTYNQMYPFRWAVGQSGDVSAQDQANRFRAVLDHMGALTAPGAVPP